VVELCDVCHTEHSDIRSFQIKAKGPGAPRNVDLCPDHRKNVNLDELVAKAAPKVTRRRRGAKVFSSEDEIRQAENQPSA